MRRAPYSSTRSRRYSDRQAELLRRELAEGHTLCAKAVPNRATACEHLRCALGQGALRYLQVCFEWFLCVSIPSWGVFRFEEYRAESVSRSAERGVGAGGVRSVF